jgi:hypothetical protein
LRPQIVREHQPAPLAVSGLQANLVAAEGGAGGALPVGGGWAPTLGPPPPAEEGKETEPHRDPAPLAVADRGRPPRAARRCPQASALPSTAGSSARPHGGARRWCLEQMSHRRWSRSRRWCGLPASVAAGGEIGDGMRPPVPCRRGGACLLRRWGEMHERSHEGNEKREKNEWMRPGGTSG